MKWTLTRKVKAEKMAQSQERAGTFYQKHEKSWIEWQGLVFEGLPCSRCKGRLLKGRPEVLTIRVHWGSCKENEWGKETKNQKVTLLQLPRQR